MFDDKFMAFICIILVVTLIVVSVFVLVLTHNRSIAETYDPTKKAVIVDKGTPGFCINCACKRSGDERIN